MYYAQKKIFSGYYQNWVHKGLSNSSAPKKDRMGSPSSRASKKNGRGLVDLKKEIIYSSLILSPTASSFEYSTTPVQKSSFDELRDLSRQLQKMSEKPTLRSTIYCSYSSELPSRFMPETTDPISMMMAVNKLYSDRLHHDGVWYADDYILKFGHSLKDLVNIIGMANPNFWDMSVRGCFFRAKHGVRPSHALNAFFQGPTFPDCGVVIQAIFYNMMLNVLGPDRFDRIFSAPGSQFILSAFLYTPFEVKDKKNDRVDGSPIHFLFDDVNTNQLQHGDIVHITGVKDYPKKHLHGFTGGWNFICVRDDPEEELKFIGFGPQTFTNGPLTFDQVRKEFIEFYNQPQTDETKHRIKQFTTMTPTTEEELCDHAHAQLASVMADDVKPDDHPIGGFTTTGTRFNWDKFWKFVNRVEKMGDWAKEKREPSPRQTGQLEQKIPFSQESASATFDNYNVTNDLQQKMKQIAERFAQVASIRNRGYPVALLYSGTPGIGKTHLTVAITKFALEHGVRVLFVDDAWISEQFQLSGGTLRDFTPLFNNVDLIVLDDINTNYGIGATFLKQAIIETIQKNSALLISSNIEVDLHKMMPVYVGYNDPFRYNCVALTGLEIQTYRRPWTDNAVGNQEKCALMAQTNSGCGLVFETHNDDLSTMFQKYQEVDPTIDPNKVRFVDEPYRNNVVYDYYCHGAENYGMAIIRVYNSGSCEQLLQLLNKSHDRAIKILVVTPSIAKMKEHLQKIFGWYTMRETAPRLKDRFRTVFPGIL